MSNYIYPPKKLIKSIPIKANIAQRNLFPRCFSRNRYPQRITDKTLEADLKALTKETYIIVIRYIWETWVKRFKSEDVRKEGAFNLKIFLN